VLELALGLAALLIGATGTFSPCGLSVIDTIGPTGHTGGRRITATACAAFLPGAIGGALLTFGALALLGQALHGIGGRVAYAVAAAIAVGAAILEARGIPIVPQIRRQLPEHWRRVLPMPLAATLYGVLLGVGFTTFVLSFGVWALAGISLALGDPRLGLIVGACFGIGRAVPIVALAPLAGSSAGIRATRTMCERDSVYAGVRRGDAVVLLLAAVALIVAPGSAGASGVQIPHATDPAATADTLLFQKLGGPAVMNRGSVSIPLPGSHPAIGGPYIATVVGGNSVQLLDRSTLAPIAQIPAPGADAIAVSQSWLAYRAASGGADGIYVRYIANPASPGPIVQVASAGGVAQLSPPATDGAVLLYATASPDGSRVIQRVLGTDKQRTLVHSRRLLLFDPSISGKAFSYVRSDARHSRLIVRGRRRHGAGRILYSIRPGAGTLWSEALTDSFAYVTILEPRAANGADASIVGISRAHPRRLRERAPLGGGNHLF